jgi:uncharacterized protein (UPF0332 family)
MALNHERLVRLGKANASTINTWKEGVSLQTKGGKPIAQLCLEVAAGRWKLAYNLRSSGNICLNRGQPLIRDAISRYYYALYHALRASAFVFHGGDDHEAHKELPGNLPTDFPNRLFWSNQLKSARDYRTRADYDPYPRGITHWRPIALSVKSDADQLLPIARQYLLTKGCVIV